MKEDRQLYLEFGQLFYDFDHQDSAETLKGALAFPVSRGSRINELIFA
jgi:hypothetical protein